VCSYSEDPALSSELAMVQKFTSSTKLPSTAAWLLLQATIVAFIAAPPQLNYLGNPAIKMWLITGSGYPAIQRLSLSRF
jgi:hypothetical protein